MLSNRFLRIFSIAIKTGNYFGSFAFSFDPVKIKASRSVNPMLENKIVRNHVFCIFLVLTCFIVVIKEYLYGTINELLFKFLFFYGIMLMLLIHFVANYYLDDLVLFTNAAFGFLRYIHGT